MSAMNIQGIVFDLDGVITSTDEYNYQSWKVLADRLGIYFDRTINNRCRGISRINSLDVVLEKAPRVYSKEEKEALCAEKNKIYLTYLAKMTPDEVNEDTRSTLAALKARGLKLAIGSSSKNTHAVLHQIGMDHTFDAVADGNEIVHAKPDPEIFLLAAKKIALKPEECLVIEDAEAGIEAANRGGFYSVGISAASHSPAAFASITRLSDLLPLLDSFTKIKDS
jgi:beta-phosphoglucomutase